MIRGDWNIDRGLLFGTLILAALGLVMVFNASIPASEARFHSAHFLFYRQLIWVLLGVLTLFAAIQIPAPVLNRSWVVWGLVSLTYAMLVGVFFLPKINGTHRWLHLFGQSFQPSEFAKLTTLIFLSWYLSRHDNVARRPIFHLGRVSLVILPMALLILAEPDLGNTSILVMILVLFLFFSGFPLRWLVAGGGIALCGLVGALLFKSYQISRITTFLDPEKDPSKHGYQILQSLIAVGHSGFWGLGIGQSTQKLFFLPEPHTDFVYAVLSEELGVPGCLALALLTGYLFYRGIKVSHNSSVVFCRWLGMGLITLLLVQTLINNTMVLGMMPTKGIPLPFISMGGTSLVMNFLSMGLVISISREVAE